MCAPEHITINNTYTYISVISITQAQEAYEVLSDPDRRRVYDRVGLTVMKILEVQAFDPQVVKNFQVCIMMYAVRIQYIRVCEIIVDFSLLSCNS